MRDLTGGVAALRDRFAKDGRDRAAAIHERLAAYALDRHEAIAIWRGSPRRGQQAGARPSVRQFGSSRREGTSRRRFEMSAVAFASLDPAADEPTGGEDGSIALDPSNAFVTSPAVQDITERALAYLEAGYAVHLSGPPAPGRRRSPSTSRLSSAGPPS